jgi:hypothetical protein
MDTPLLISAVHEAVTASVPYDVDHISRAFYSLYTTLPVEGAVNWGEDIIKQKRFMTLGEAFTLMSQQTKNMGERGAILDRFIGHIASRCKVPYDMIEAGARAIFNS